MKNSFNTRILFIFKYKVVILHAHMHTNKEVKKKIMKDNEITPCQLKLSTVPWHRQDDELQCLSQEVQECIQFFDETIVSLEESLQEEDRSPGQMKPPTSSRGPVDMVDGQLTLSHSSMSSIPARPPSPKDQDIIDLVRPEPDLVQQPIFSPTSPGTVQQLGLFFFVFFCCFLALFDS